jgi:hypothetical protein
LQPGPGGAPLPPNRDVCWSEEPEPNGLLLASDQILTLGVESEIANDVTLDENRTITRVRWWGGYYNTIMPCGPGIAPPGLYLRFYENPGCLPLQFPHDNPYAEFVISGPAGEAFVCCQQETSFPLYRYETDVSVTVIGSVRCWFGVQMADHPFPPQWGRLTAGTVTGCESVIWVNTIGWPEWDPMTWVLGFPADVSQEFDAMLRWRFGTPHGAGFVVCTIDGAVLGADGRVRTEWL